MIMKRFFSWIIALPVFIFLAAFALANRNWMTVSFDPITPSEPLVSMSMPVWALLFGGVFIGLVSGGIATWLRQSKWRRVARKALGDLDKERMKRRRLENRLKDNDNIALAPPVRRAS